MDKNLIREKNLLLRKTLDKKEAEKKILSEIKKSDAFLRAKNVLIFYPMKYEIDLLGLLTEEKKFYLPRVEGDNLVICPFYGELKKSAFGVLEPQTDPVSPSIIDVAYIPALAVDKNLNRIGYGKGFYDRLFLNPEFKAQKIVVICKEFTEDIIDPSPYDVKVDGVIKA